MVYDVALKYLLEEVKSFGGIYRSISDDTTQFLCSKAVFQALLKNKSVFDFCESSYKSGGSNFLTKDPKVEARYIRVLSVFGAKFIELEEI